MVESLKIPKRTEEEILAAVHGPVGAGADNVILGGRNYLIRPIKGRANSRWFRKQIGPILDKIQDIAPLVMLYTEKEEGTNLDLNSEHVESLVGLFKQLGGPHFDVLLDTVYRWSPEINKDRWYLEGYELSEDGFPVDVSGNKMVISNGELLEEENVAMSGEGATDQEFLSAFLVILRMVYGPFVQALGLQMSQPAQTMNVRTSTDQSES